MEDFIKVQKLDVENANVIYSIKDIYVKKSSIDYVEVCTISYVLGERLREAYKSSKKIKDAKNIKNTCILHMRNGEQLHILDSVDDLIRM